MDFDTVNSRSDFNTLFCALNAGAGFEGESFNRLCADTDEQTALKIIARLSESLQDASKKLIAGLEESNNQLVWNVCHKVAGSSELVGFKTFAKRAKELCLQAKASNDVSILQGEIKNLAEEALRLSERIHSGCPNLNRYAWERP